MRAPAFLVCLGLVFSSSASGQDHLEKVSTPQIGQPPSVLDRVLPPGRVFCDTLTPRCASVALIKAGIQVGIEWEYPPPDDRHQPFDYGGMTVRELLMKAAEADPSVEWREVDGLLVLRSQAAWEGRSTSLLSHPVESPFVLHDVDLSTAAWRVARGEPAPKGLASENIERLFPGDRVSLELHNATLLDALNAVARKNRRVSWQVTNFGGEWPFSGFDFFTPESTDGGAVVER